MANIDDVVQAISASVTAIGEVQSRINHTSSDAGAISEGFASLGAQSPAGHMSAAQTSLGEVSQHLAAAVKAANEANSRAQSAKGEDGLPTGSQRLEPQADYPQKPVFNPRVFDASRMSGIRRYSQAGTAEGNLYFPPGDKVNDKPIHATPGQSAFRPGELKPGYENTKPATGHVEGNAAAAMHHHGHTEACLYMNTYPCRTEPGNCHTELHKYIPEDGKMYIHAQLDDGTPYYKRVTGSGEALT